MLKSVKFLWSKHSTIAKAIALCLGVFFVCLFLYLSLKRVFFPYEIEWMEGSITEHALRIFQGKQLYIKPSIDFINWIYQPLYYYTVAAIMHITGVSYLSGRLVSFSSTILTCILLYAAVYRLTDTAKSYAFIAPCLYLAEYSMRGFSYDIARIDSLFVLLAVCSVVILLYSKRAIAVVSSAIFLALAFFYKTTSACSCFTISCLVLDY